MPYDEIYMQEQNHPAWKNDRMRPSSATLGAKGCFIDCARYSASRLYFKMIPIKETNQKMGNIAGYTLNGDAKWDAIRKVLGIVISRTKPSTSKKVIIWRNVWIHGKDNSVFSHWVVELSGGQCFDPLRQGGKFVHLLSEFPPVFIKPGVLNRRFIIKA